MEQQTMATKTKTQTATKARAFDTLLDNWRSRVGSDAAAILAASKYAPKPENADKPRSMPQAAFLRNLLKLGSASNIPETATVLDCWRAISLAQYEAAKSGKNSLGRTSIARSVLATYLGIQLEAIDEAAASKRASRAVTTSAAEPTAIFASPDFAQMLAAIVGQAVAAAMATNAQAAAPVQRELIPA
jgi:hypothetical protein